MVDQKESGLLRELEELDKMLNHGTWPSRLPHPPQYRDLLEQRRECA